MWVLALFFCSGATALVYEVVWSKYLALMFGSTVQAQTVVLAVFMGGLALGNRIFGVKADRSPQPLAIYGYLEVAIGIYAFLFSWIYKAADLAFIKVGSQIMERGGWLLAWKGFLSVALLLGPTILMGGTLPILAAWLQKSGSDAGRRSARFYSTNSLGAVFGAALAGFYLVQELGLTSALQMTSLINVIIGFAAVGIARKQGAPVLASAPNTEKAPVPVAGALADERPWLAFVMVTVTGAVSMGLEVLASRSLALIFGASLQAFAIVLMSFILGIGLGSAVIASPRWRRLDREALTICLLLGASAVLLLLVANIERWVDVYRYARSGLARTEIGYLYHQLLSGGLSMVVLGVPAGLIGAVLPLWIRTGEGEGGALGGRVGRLLTWNTLGAVLGSLATGFILMPRLGLRGAFTFFGATLALAALVCGNRGVRRWPMAVAAVVVTLQVWVGLTGDAGWRHVFSSGVFRARETDVSRSALELRKKHVKIVFYEDAADATVTVEQTDGTFGQAQTVLRINGKPDATSHGDLATQYLLAHVPMLARPSSKDVFVLGVGSGVTAGALLGYPVESITVAENCEPVLRAARFFEPWNRKVLSHPRTRIWNEDARTVLKLSPKEYDIIISEPSNPWMAGVGSVFSREFYELCAKRLKPGGIMTQWFHLYEMHDGITALVLRTFSSVFPYLEVWDPGVGDIIIIGSQQPWSGGIESYRQVYGVEAPRADLVTIGLPTPESVYARQMASLRTGFAIAGDGPSQSDEFPVLEYEAPRAFFVGAQSRLLFQYDERTWQSDLAPAEKRSALDRLDDPGLRTIFSQYSSVNSDLDRHLKLRFRGLDPDAAARFAADARPMPSLFIRRTATNEPPTMPPGASEELRLLLASEALFRSQPAQWQRAVTAIQQVLAGAASKQGSVKLDWPAAQYAALAARACLREQAPGQAGALIELGLKLDPDSDELRYLGRVATREQGGAGRKQ
jgi:spermidine synthase